MPSHTIIMGILNATPDSFADGTGELSLQKSLERASLLINEKADIIDIGGESSRPGAPEVSVEEELSRTIPLIQELKKITAIPLSIDTRKPKVAKSALDSGASLLNDINGLENPEMRKLAKSYECDVCIMHMQGDPQTMQQKPHYPEGIINHLTAWFEKRIELLLKEGISLEKIIIDPGIGFGKTVEDNLSILGHIAHWKKWGLRILIGLSRKSFMAKILKKETRELLPATLAMNTIAILAGADIIRVHDVQEHKDVAALVSKFRERNGT